MKSDLKSLLLPHLRELSPYSNARAEFKGKASVWLDANENPFHAENPEGYNRYPDPLQNALKTELANLWNVHANQLFLGNGSDEPIDLLIRLFCAAGKDSILVQEPTYSMYKQSAAINNVAVISVPLSHDFQPQEALLLKTIAEQQPKLVFFCSPNNPTGNTMSLTSIQNIAEKSNGIVVVDEAYIDFCPNETAVTLLKNHTNIVVLRTLSKAWGLAALRLGAAIASPEMVEYFNLIKPPYNINAFTQQFALNRLKNGRAAFEKQVGQLNTDRETFSDFLSQLPGVFQVFPSKANFVLATFDNTVLVYNQLIEKGIVVRRRDGQVANALRFSIGTTEEIKQLKTALKEILA